MNKKNHKRFVTCVLANFLVHHRGIDRSKAFKMAHAFYKAMEKLAKERAEIVYNEIDRNRLFVGTAQEDSRSLMNITFVLKDEYKELEKDFLDFATSKGMVGVKGHRDVGGFRASCYNAMSIEGVKALTACMQEYEKAH